MVFDKPTFEFLDSRVYIAWLDINFRRSTPNRNCARAIICLHEIAYVLTQLFDHVRLVDGLLYICSMQSLYVLRVECGAHWANLAELITNWLDMPALEDLRGFGGFVGVVGKEVPSSKDKLIELSK